MAWNSNYASALAAAFVMFALTGGIQAAEKAAKVVEQSRGPVVAGVTIPFPNSNIRDWRPDGYTALYVQDQHRRWYRATFFAPCNDLPFAERIGFVTQGPDQLDKFSAILVRGQRCQFQNLVASDGPPKPVKADKPAKG